MRLRAINPKCEDKSCDFNEDRHCTILSDTNWCDRTCTFRKERSNEREQVDPAGGRKTE